LAVNCYVEAVYSLDAEVGAVSATLPKLSARLRELGFKIEEHPHSVNAQAPGSDLRIQFTTDERYQAFPARCVEANVLGLRAKVASLEDATQGKLWAYSDPRRRLSKGKKDELDLTRLAEAHPELKTAYPSELREQVEKG
jgi:hypothetical protein